MNREIKFRCWYDLDKEMIYNSCPCKNYSAFIMQYTGLKDKNGKEIYEGDIVNNHYMNQSKICTINFEEGYFMVNYKNQIDPIQDHFCNENNSCAWFEIIGNIHENPELLKG